MQRNPTTVLYPWRCDASKNLAIACPLFCNYLFLPWTLQFCSHAAPFRSPCETCDRHIRTMKAPRHHRQDSSMPEMNLGSINCVRRQSQAMRERSIPSYAILASSLLVSGRPPTHQPCDSPSEVGWRTLQSGSEKPSHAEYAHNCSNPRPRRTFLPQPYPSLLAEMRAPSHVAAEASKYVCIILQSPASCREAATEREETQYLFRKHDYVRQPAFHTPLAGRGC